jgi:hypothetical protein
LAAITLVCTCHNERGACTEDALLGILRDLDPDVVFLEARASDLDAFATQWLEVRAIQRYSQLRRVEAVPVDDFKMPASLRSDMDAVFNYVERHSVEFSALEDERDMAAALGFEAMNGGEFEAVVEKCESSMKRSVLLSNNKELITRHATWTSFLRQREDTMLANIYDYCRRSPHLRCAFLVGAAHLSSLVRGIEGRAAQEVELVRWELWSRPGRFSHR